MLVRMPVRQSSVMSCDEICQESPLTAEFLDSMKSSRRGVIDSTLATLDVSIWIKPATMCDIVLEGRGIFPEVMPQACQVPPVSTTESRCKLFRQAGDSVQMFA